MTAPAAIAVKVARAIHRVLVVLLARDVRRRYRAEIIATFEAASADAARRGTAPVVRLLFQEIADLATARRANQPAGVPEPPQSAGRSRLHDFLPAWRQSWRSLRRRPAFFLAVVLTLGVGTGITAAIFSLVDTVLIKPLPYPDPDRLVTVYESSPTGRERTSLIAPARLADWQRLNQSFVALSSSYSENVTDTSGDMPERLEGRRVTARFFDVYATPPIAGRHFVEAEEREGGPGAVVMSERFWVRRFNRDPGAIGRTLVIGGRPFEIVGVMPATFTSAPTDVWLPAQLGSFFNQLRDARFLNGVGRLRPGVTIEAATQELASIQQALGRQFPATDVGWAAELRPLKDVRIGDSRRGLLLVSGAVGLLWLIAIANLAGLILVQARRRGRELAVRTALGASRARAIGLMVREGVLIATSGAAIGTALAAWLISAMPGLLSQTPRINELQLDWRALVFVAATSLLAAMVFSLVPALASTRLRLTHIISGTGRGFVGGPHRMQHLLVLGQVALSMLLVGSATLLLRGYYDLTHADTGFDASNVITFRVAARWNEDRPRIGQLQEQLVGRVAQLPYVEAVGLANFLPTSGGTLRYQIRIEGVAGPNADGSITVGARMIGGDYLRAIRAPLVAGEWCPPLRMDFKTPRVALVNKRLVDTHAPGHNLLGRTARLTDRTGDVLTIVGVVGDLAEDGPATTRVPYVYTCNSAGAWPDPNYVARTTGATAFAADLRRIVHELDSTRAVYGVRPIQEALDSALERPRLDATLIGLFAGAAVTLAAVGLYSLFMLIVAERSREMAVRLAIGAAPREMIRLVMTGAGRLLAAGLAIGIVLAAVADRVLRSVLSGVSPLDVLALGAAALTLAVVSAIAVAGPAIKASRIDPIVTLRTE